MNKKKLHSKRKKGVSAIIGGILFFGMVFTVLFGYFYSVTQANQSYQIAARTNNNLVLQQSQENMIVGGSVNGTGYLKININNTGTSVGIASFFVINNTNGLTIQYKSGNGALLGYANQGKSASLNTAVLYVTGQNYLLKVLTVRGNLFSGVYSPSSNSQGSNNAITAGALGDLYLVFGSYTYYTIISHSSQASCPGSAVNATYSNYCLQTTGANKGPAFAVPSAIDSSNIGFSINMTDLNAQQKDIILDQFTLMYQSQLGGGSGSHVEWIIWSIATVGAISAGYIPILNNFQLQVLHANVSKIIYFMMENCVTASNGPITENTNCKAVSSNTFTTPSALNPPALANVFLLEHGWEESTGSYVIAQGQANSLVYTGVGLATNYGQNSPYVSTLYE